MMEQDSISTPIHYSEQPEIHYSEPEAHYSEQPEIHYSEQPDTLHLPGEGIPRDLTAVDVPIYYRENYFSDDSLYHLELGADKSGISGTPISHGEVHSDLITGLLIVCFLIACVVLSQAPGFMTRQIKLFFSNKTSDHSDAETGTELKMQLLLLSGTCVIVTILYFLYTLVFNTDTFTLTSNYVLLGIFMIAFMAYYAIQFLLYMMVNGTFFEQTENKKFLTSRLFLSSLEGILLFPAIVLLAFLHFSSSSIIIYTAIILILVKILAFYKSYIIFFKQKRFFLQIILYFCTLEIIPLLMLLSGLSVIVDILKVNY